MQKLRTSYGDKVKSWRNIPKQAFQRAGRVICFFLFYIMQGSAIKWNFMAKDRAGLVVYLFIYHRRIIDSKKKKKHCKRLHLVGIQVCMLENLDFSQHFKVRRNFLLRWCVRTTGWRCDSQVLQSARRGDKLDVFTLASAWFLVNAT